MQVRHNGGFSISPRTVATLAILGLVLALLAALPPTAVAAQPVDEVHYPFTSQTSVAIDWRGDANDVRWGPDTGYGQTATGSPPAWTPRCWRRR